MRTKLLNHNFIVPLIIRNNDSIFTSLILDKIFKIESVEIEIICISKMFIKRSDNKLKTQKIVNQFPHSDQINQSHNGHSNRELELVSYPVLAYLLGLGIIGVSIYLLYSVGGGINSIEGFNNKLWWQYILALIPMAFGIGFIIACQIQKLYLSRKNNLIIYVKIRFFCFVTEEMKMEFHDLIGLSVIRAGTERYNVTMVNYHIVLSFSTYKELEVLSCLSSSKILDYFQQLRHYFDKAQISQKKIAIQNLVE